MKYFIYIVFILIIQSCVTTKELPIVVSETESKDSLFVDSSFIDSSFIDSSFIDSTIIQSENREGEIKEYLVNPKVSKGEKVKVEVVDNTTSDDIKNESIGIMAYSVPDQMVVGKSYTIKLRISKEKNKIQLISGDRKITINDVNVDSKITIESIRVEPIMSASLLSDEGKFLINPVSTEIQNIEDKGYTEWQWRLTPLRGGDNFLKLIVKVRISNENGEFYKDITVFDKSIKVKSNVVFSIKTWISTYWQWLISTIFIPLIVWFYKRNKKEKSK
jgi:hypothetical protein